MSIKLALKILLKQFIQLFIILRLVSRVLLQTINTETFMWLQRISFYTFQKNTSNVFIGD